MKPDKMQMKFMQDHPTPGASLTAGKEQKFPFTRPPELVDKQQALDFMWKKVSSPKALPQLIGLLRQDVPVVDIAQVFAKAGFAEGKWSVDMSMQLVEPATFMIMHIARKVGIDYVFSKDIPDLNAYARGEQDDFLKKAMDEGAELPKMEEEEPPTIEGGLMGPDEGLM